MEVWYGGDEVCLIVCVIEWKEVDYLGLFLFFLELGIQVVDVDDVDIVGNIGVMSDYNIFGYFCCFVVVVEVVESVFWVSRFLL